MRQLKIGIATGDPFVNDVIGHLGISTSVNSWIFGLGSQISSNNKGIRPATHKEILANQHFIREHWTPEVGDHVVISSPLSSFMNKEGKIVEKRTNQFEIKFSKYVVQLAYCLEDIVPRAEDWAVIKEEIDDEYSSLVFNNVEFKKLDAGVQADLRKLDLDFVKTIFSLVTRISNVYEKKSLGSFLGYFTIWNETPQGYVFWQEINNWVYKDRFEDANNSFKEWKLKQEEKSLKETKEVEPRPEPIMEEIYPKRFKVGDKVTYKSLEEVGGYYFHGGEDHGDFVGTIIEYVYYNEDKKCYRIRVTSKESFNYLMLESEFREYDNMKEPVPIAEKLKPEPKFKVGDRVTYKPHSELGRGYHYKGDNHGGFVGTIVKYVDYNEDKNCYKINVTSKESFDYIMLESEFREYDELKPSVSSKFYVEVPVPEVYRHNVVLVEKKEKVKEITDSSLYSQEPVLLSKRPVKTKIKPII